MRPYLFRLPEWLPGVFSGRPIFSYGVMLGLSFIFGWYLTSYFATKEGFDSKVTGNTLFLAIVGALFGARLLFFVSNPSLPFSLKSFFSYQDGGLVAYGGYLGGIFFSYAYLRWKKNNFFAFADQATPQLALGLGFTRVGCFMYGCDYGRPTDSFLGISFPRWGFDSALSQYGLHKGSAAFNHHVNKCVQLLNDVGKLGEINYNPGNMTTTMVEQCKAFGAKIHGTKSFEALAQVMTQSFPVHPTQLYASLAGFAIFAFLLWARKHRRFDGQVFLLFLLTYGIFRFLIEFVRDDLQRGNVGVLSTSQFISLLLVGAAGIGWWLLPRQLNRLTLEPAPAKTGGGKKRKH
ncbi:MAG: prolipoprotein diacylglyceryl transferase [Myxococcales bacterium]|nr:prolipoprotein diacylglyceryl transferase [Myxococcales bacterium]